MLHRREMQTPKECIFIYMFYFQIAAVYCICGALAREAAEAGDGEPPLELVSSPAAAIADLLHEDPGSWIASHGGWVGHIRTLANNCVSK